MLLDYIKIMCQAVAVVVLQAALETGSVLLRHAATTILRGVIIVIAAMLPSLKVVAATVRTEVSLLLNQSLTDYLSTFWYITYEPLNIIYGLLADSLLA
jgi:hypothetical protein